MSRRLPLSLALGGLLALASALPAMAQETFYFRMNISPTSVEIPPTVIGLVNAAQSNFTLDAEGLPEGTLLAPQTQTLTFQNVADPAAPVTISSVAITSGGANFTIAADNCTGQVLAPAATCTIDVSFTASSGGTYSGVLTLYSPG
jgi:hypothetical protein